MTRMVMGIVILVGLACAATRIVDVSPRANYNEKVLGDEDHGVRQTFTNTVDDAFLWCDVFIGAQCAHLDGFLRAEIREHPSGPIVAEGQTWASASYSYARIIFPDTASSVHPVKGKEYKLTITL